MRMKSSFLFFVALLFSFSRLCVADGYGANGSIAGIIRDSSGSPLVGAWVSLLDGRFGQRIQKTALTNAEGKFDLQNVLPGLYSLRVSVANYAPLMKSGIRVFSGRIADLSLVLQGITQAQDNEAGPTGKQGRAVEEDIESVLRSTASTRPILRILDEPADEPAVDANLELSQEPARPNEMRGMVSVYTTAFAVNPYVMAPLGASTEFAFARQMSGRTDLAVAGVASDESYAEVETLLRVRGVGQHNPSFRLSFAQLPFLKLIPQMIGDKLDRVNVYSLDIQDELKISSAVSLFYGIETQGTSGVGYRVLPRWRVEIQPFGKSQVSFFRTSSLPQLNRTMELPEGESIILSSPFHQGLGNGPKGGLVDVTHTEFAAQQQLGSRSLLLIGVYSDRFRLPFSNGGVVSGWNSDQWLARRGVRVAYRHAWLDRLDSTVGYTYGGGLSTTPDVALIVPHNVHVLAAKLSAEVPYCNTQVATTYRWMSGYSITVVDPYQELFESSSPQLSILITQMIPYFGRFLPGRLEAQLEMWNLFANQQADDKHSMMLRHYAFVQASKAVRGGIKLEF